MSNFENFMPSDCQLCGNINGFLQDVYGEWVCKSCGNLYEHPETRENEDRDSAPPWWGEDECDLEEEYEP